MDNTNQSGSQQSAPSGTDISGVEVTTGSAPVSIAPKREIEPPTVTEHIKLSEPELNIHPEIAKIGVEKTAEHPVLTPKDYEAGMKLSEQKPLIADEQKLQSAESLPMTESQAIHVVKTGKADSTKSWFANLVLKVIGKFNVKKQNELNAKSV